VSEVRLEFRPFPEKRFYLDICCRGPEQSLAIELKYLIRGLDVVVDGERFLLRNQAAQDISRHDVIKDIVRVERITSEVSGTRGYIVALTNDSSYWKQSLRADTVDAAFRLHEGGYSRGRLHGPNSQASVLQANAPSRWGCAGVTRSNGSSTPLSGAGWRASSGTRKWRSTSHSEKETRVLVGSCRLRAIYQRHKSIDGRSL
jgi:hypothetical protein